MNYKRKANITLAVVVVLFIITALLRNYYKDVTFIRMLYSVSEAALIGGMADWFAVTAIFRKPLGFPFHTAIIPRNRKTIVKAVSNIVEKEFLSKEMLNQKLDTLNITDKIINYFDSNEGRALLYEKLSSLLKKDVDKKAKQITKAINSLLSNNIENKSFREGVNKIIALGLTSGEYKTLRTFLLDDIIKIAEGPEVKSKISSAIEAVQIEKTQGFFGALVNSALEGANIVNTDELTDSIHIQLMTTLYNLKDDENETTKYLLGIVEEHLILNGDLPFGDEELGNIKDKIFEGIITEEAAKDFLLKCSENLEKLNSCGEEVALKEENEVFYIIIKQASTFWNGLKNNNEMKNSIEAFIKNSISTFIEREHSVIGKIVIDTLESFSDEELNKFIEDRAGNDLQWIRVNGSVVGGMVGLLVFLFLNYFYDPIAVPFIKALFKA